jgi:membrane fusion protein (multidrug efflux system)
MVDGFQKLQMLPPGTPVKPVPWQAPAVQQADAAPAAGGAPQPAAGGTAQPAAEGAKPAAGAAK